ncbi:MAG: sulfotransferase [Gemmataceae bacterium]
MAWRDTFLRHLGPGLLSGITAGDWARVLADNGFAVAPSRLPKAASVTCQSVQNSALAWYERWRYGPAVAGVAVPPPVFVLGHWRGGTTHLHYLLAADDRFAFPNNYQCLFPHSFLTTEAAAARLVAHFLPDRRPMDDVRWTIRSPQEDEFALNIATGLSPCMGWIFPRRREHYDRYLTLRDATAAEVEGWKAALLVFARKLTWKYGRPLVLKSPPHTARVRLLLELFPGAKFVHICRDPYAVFSSTRHMFRVNGELNRLQPARRDDPDGWVLRQYRAMYDAYFEDRRLIPAGDLTEIRFEDLEADPVGLLRRVYENLELPDFGPAEPVARRYVDSVAVHRKNVFPELPPALRTRVADECRAGFEAWGYPV